MPLIVNLSTTHDYSIDETVRAFVALCNVHSRGCLQSMPGFFQNGTNYVWVMAKYQTNYASLIEPYKLGKISTPQFLKNLSQIFYFMNELEEENREALLIYAWNASIKLSEKTQDRLSHLVELAKTQQVYLISNTNELNVLAIIQLFKQHNPNLKFNPNMEFSIAHVDKPIEVLPNVFLCLSYRYGALKEGTVSIIEKLAQNSTEQITLISQFPGDLKKGEQLGLKTVNASEFYNADVSDSLAPR